MNAHAECFHLLAECCREPDKDLLDEHIFDQLALSLDSESDRLSAQRMGRALEVTPPEELRAEYQRLFMGPDGRPAPACASVYIDPGRQVMGETTVAVEHAFEAAGMPVATREPADHIAQLLEFAHYLEASGKDPEPFVEKYVRPWARRFCRKLRADTRYAYFAVLSECLEHFLYPRKA